MKHIHCRGRLLPQLYYRIDIAQLHKVCGVYVGRVLPTLVGSGKGSTSAGAGPTGSGKGSTSC